MPPTLIMHRCVVVVVVDGDDDTVPIVVAVIVVHLVNVNGLLLLLFLFLMLLSDPVICLVSCSRFVPVFSLCLVCCVKCELQGRLPSSLTDSVAGCRPPPPEFEPRPDCSSVQNWT